MNETSGENKAWNLAEKTAMGSDWKIKREASKLFTIPGTNLVVSVACVKMPCEGHPDGNTNELMVYIREKEDGPNVGYLHFDTETHLVRWSVEGLKI